MRSWLRHRLARAVSRRHARYHLAKRHWNTVQLDGSVPPPSWRRPPTEALRFQASLIRRPAAHPQYAAAVLLVGAVRALRRHAHYGRGCTCPDADRRSAEQSARPSPHARCLSSAAKGCGWRSSTTARNRRNRSATTSQSAVRLSGKILSRAPPLWAPSAAGSLPQRSAKPTPGLPQRCGTPGANG